MLNLPNLFQALSRAGRTAYLIDSGQVNQGGAFSELIGYPWVAQNWWATSLGGSIFDSGIRAQSGAMTSWQQSMQNILLGMITAVNPTFGANLPTALGYLYNQMVVQGQTVKQFNVGQTVTPDVGNVGTGSIFASTIRSDGLSLQHIVPELATLLVTADSYTGGAKRGQEPWLLTGAPNVSSLGTGIGVGRWDWDWPQGSNASLGGNFIAAFDYANSNGNFLTNGDFATWNSGVPTNFNLVSGAIVQNATQQLGGLYCIQFNPGSAELTTQFGNNATPAGATAGTPISLVAYLGYCTNFFFKAAPGVTGGTAVISLVNSSGGTITDQQGIPQTFSINLASLSTLQYQAFTFALRTPVILPADGILRLDIKINGLTGAAVYMDQIAFTQPRQFYAGGSTIAAFSNPAFPFESQPEPDGFQIQFTNDGGGVLYGASWQTLLLRLFNTPQLIVPYSNAPTILDSLITAP